MDTTEIATLPTLPKIVSRDHRAANGIAKCPESLCLMLALLYQGDVYPTNDALHEVNRRYRTSNCLITGFHSALRSFSLCWVA